MNDEAMFLIIAFLIILIIFALMCLAEWIWEKHDKKQQLLIKRAIERREARLMREGQKI